jgi:hypothetical protein
MHSVDPVKGAYDIASYFALENKLESSYFISFSLMWSGKWPVKPDIVLEVGWKNKYRYPSFGLQFDVKNDSNRWIIGSSNRNAGSIHSDIWEGTASEFSQNNIISIKVIY